MGNQVGPRTGPRDPGPENPWIKSLKFILIDSKKIPSPCPDSGRHARCFVCLFEEFLIKVKISFSKTRVSQG
jgi:hypothetical protein